MSTSSVLGKRKLEAGYSRTFGGSDEDVSTNLMVCIPIKKTTRMSRMTWMITATFQQNSKMVNCKIKLTLEPTTTDGIRGVTHSVIVLSCHMVERIICTGDGPRSLAHPNASEPRGSLPRLYRRSWCRRMILLTTKCHPVMFVLK